MESPANSAPHARRGLCLYLLLLLTFLLYAPSLANDFTWDDRYAAMGHNGSTRNPLVDELQPLPVYFESNYWPAKSERSRAYRPFTVLTYALRHALVGDDPVVAHLINVLLHVLATFLAYVLLARLGAAWPAACAGALVFGVHAIHSEAVANIVGRAEILGFVFGAAGLLALGSARNRAGARRGLLGVLAAAGFYLAFHAKESALAWAAFAPLVLALQQKPASRRGFWPVVMLAVGVPALAYLVQRDYMLSLLPQGVDPIVGYLENPLLEAPWMTRAMTGFLAWGYGLLLTAFPFDLAVDYGPCQLPIVTGVWQWGFLGTVAAMVVLATLLALATWNLRRHRLPFLAIACFLGFSFIVTNIPLPVFMMFAERSYYTPSLGLALLVAWLAGRVAVRPGLRSLALVALGMWAGASSLMAWQRNGVWRDDETLIRLEVEAHPDSVRLQLCAGDLHRARGDLVAAAEHFARAARIDPQGPDAWCELAGVRLAQGRLGEAAEALEGARQGREPDRRHLQGEIDALAQRILVAAPR